MHDGFYEPVKKLGQNFLTDLSVVHQMISALELGNEEIVVEVGPGLGVLTEELAQHMNLETSRLYAVDVDPRFVNKLEQMFVDDRYVEIIEDDILQWLPKFDPPGEYKVLGSLPYYITSPILHAITRKTVRPRVCVLLMQKEVAEKVMQKAPAGSYLSVFIQSFFDVEYLGKVEKDKFNPVPKVDGGILRLRSKGVKMSRDQVVKYEGFLHKAFKNPRKMLNKVFSKEELETFGFNPRARPQEISANFWLEAFYATQA